MTNLIPDKFVNFDEHDKKLWVSIAIFGAVGIALFSAFTTSSPLMYLMYLLRTLLMVFIPGYVITKLHLPNFHVSDNPVLDRFILSFGASVVILPTLYFLATYVRTYALNVDEEVISSDKIAIFLVLLVIGCAIGARYYLLKKSGQISTPAESKPEQQS